MIPDLINGVFELVGGAMVWQNVRRIRRDQQVRGVDWRVTVFFSAWGFWNLFYYPHLDQWLSTLGGLAIVSANTAWLWFAWKYRAR